MADDVVEIVVSGPQGIQGPQGLQGPQGVQGIPGVTLPEVTDARDQAVAAAAAASSSASQAASSASAASSSASSAQSSANTVPPIAAAAAASASQSQTAALTAEQYANAAAATQGFRDFESVTVLLANTTLTYTAGSNSSVVAGNIIRTRTENFIYAVAASGATDQHVTTAGGVKLYVRPATYRNKPAFNAAAFGITPATSGLVDAINRALARIAENSIFIIPSGEYVLTRATVGTVLPASMATNSGVVGAIYVDKEGQELEGAGETTHLNGNDLSLHCVMLRRSNQRVRNMRIGNVKGQLVSAEAAGVSIEPSAYPRVNPNGANIENFIVENCWFYRCESGVSAHPEAWGNLSYPNIFPTDPFTAFYKSTGVTVSGCHFVEMYRHGVELFQADNSIVENCYISVGELSGQLGSTTQRGIRALGSRDVKIHNNTLVWTKAVFGDGGLGVDLNNSGFYGVSPNSTMSSNCIVSNNRFLNFGVDISVGGAQGDVLITGNISRKPHTQVARFLRATANSPLDPAQSSTELYKLKASKILMTNNSMIGGSEFCRVDGAVDLLEIKGNTFISGDMSEIYFFIANIVNYNVGPGGATVQAAINAQNRLRFCIIENNTAITRQRVSQAPIWFQNTKAGDVAHVNYNRLTPSTAGRLLGVSTTGDGEVYVNSAESNIPIPATVWSESWNPPPEGVTVWGPVV